MSVPLLSDLEPFKRILVTVRAGCTGSHLAGNLPMRGATSASPMTNPLAGVKTLRAATSYSDLFPTLVESVTPRAHAQAPGIPVVS